jgi:hypothetical protein
MASEGPQLMPTNISNNQLHFWTGYFKQIVNDKGPLQLKTLQLQPVQYLLKYCSDIFFKLSAQQDATLN